MSEIITIRVHEKGLKSKLKSQAKKAKAKNFNSHLEKIISDAAKK